MSNFYKELLELKKSINDFAGKYVDEIDSTECELNGKTCYMHDEFAKIEGIIDDAVFVYENRTKPVDDTSAGYEYWKGNRDA